MKKSRERCSLFSSSGREKFSLEILSNSYAFSLIFSFGFFFLFRSGNVREYHHIYQCLKIDGPWFLKLTSTFSPSCLDSLAAHATRRWTAFSQMIFFHHIIEQAQWLKTPKVGSVQFSGWILTDFPAQNAWDDQPFFHDDEIHARNTVFLIFHNKLVTIKNHDVLMNRQINSPVLGWLWDWGTPLSSSKLNSLTWEEGWWVDH